MLRVFISDMHMGDGYLSDDFSFDDELIDLIDSLTGSSRETELIILGDGLELLESRAVKEMGLVPFEDVVDNVDPGIIDDIYLSHADFFSSLKRFTRVHKLRYVIGNHDYYFLRNYKLRDKFFSYLGNDSNISFSPYFYDRMNGIFAIHGSNFDPGNRFGKDKKSGEIIPPIGDFMARYMMINFQEVLLNGDIPNHIPRDFDDVRPNIDVFDWFEYVKDTYELSIDLVELWMTELIKMLRTSNAKRWMRGNYPNAHKLSNLFINKFGGIKLGRYCVKAVSKLRSLKRTNYMKRKASEILLNGAGKKESRFTDRDFWGFCDLPDIDYSSLKGIIFAHRHKFDSAIISTNGENKFYYNTGTWRKVIEKGGKKDKEKFVERAEMSYIFIEDKDGQIETKAITKNKFGNRKYSVSSVEVI